MNYIYYMFMSYCATQKWKLTVNICTLHHPTENVSLFLYTIGILIDDSILTALNRMHIINWYETGCSTRPSCIAHYAIMLLVQYSIKICF